MAVKTTWAMARVWSGPTTWTGLAEKKSTVAIPPETLARTWVVVPDKKLWRPNTDSAAVGPSSRAPRISLRLAGTGTFRDTAFRCWVGATRKMVAGTVTSGRTMGRTVVGVTGSSRWKGTSVLAMAVGVPLVGMPQAAVDPRATRVAMAASARTGPAAHVGCSGASSSEVKGSSTTNLEPPPGASSIQTVPPCSRTCSATSESPRPVPSLEARWPARLPR